MSVSIGLTGADETAAIRATNALFLSGLILDLMAAFLSYLTSRWLQMLSNDEKDQLEKSFNKQQKIALQRMERQSPLVDIENGGRDEPKSPQPTVDLELDHNGWNDKLVEICFSTSLLVSMPILAIGALCMIIGLIVYTWSQHPTVVATVVTCIFAVNLPFLAGVILISRKRERRKAIIRRLSTMQGSW